MPCRMRWGEAPSGPSGEARTIGFSLMAGQVKPPDGNAKQMLYNGGHEKKSVYP